MKFNFRIFALLLACSAWQSCTRSNLFGSDLLEQDQTKVEATDTLTIKASTLTKDSFLVYTSGNPYQYFPCGIINDPWMGTMTSTVTSGMELSSGAIPFTSNDKLDSVICYIAFDSTSVWNTSESLDIGVFTFDNNQFIGHGETYSTQVNNLPGNSVIGTYNFNPANFPDSVSKIMQIKLSNTFGKYVMNADSTTLNTPSYFKQYIKYLRFMPLALANGTQSMPAFNLDSRSSFIRLYYHTDTVYNSLDLNLFGTDLVKYVSPSRDFTSSTVQSFLNDESKGDSLLFLGGLKGTTVKLQFPTAALINDALQKKMIVNKAELELTCLQGTYDDFGFKPVKRILAYYLDTNGKEVLIDDVSFGFNTGNTNDYGGNPLDIASNNEVQKRYRINMAAYFQKMVNRLVPETVYLTVYQRAINPNRIVFKGPKSTANPLKLHLTYTKLPN